MRGQVKILQKRIIAKKRRRAFLISLYSVFVLGLAISALSLASHMRSMRIDAIEISGNSRLSSASIDMIAREKIAGNFMGLFSRSNAFLYPKDALVKALRAVPAISDVEIERSGTKTLRIKVTERTEIALWCSGGVFDTSDCYSLDENGYIFARSSFLSSSTRPVIYRTVIEGEPLGKRFLDEGDFKNLRFFMGQLEGLSVEPKEVTISVNSYMTVHLGAGGKLITDMSDDLSVVLGNIAAIISDKSVAPSLSRFLEELDYIKLDSGNKVVYKLKARPGAFAPVE